MNLLSDPINAILKNPKRHLTLYLFVLAFVYIYIKLNTLSGHELTPSEKKNIDMVLAFLSYLVGGLAAVAITAKIIVLKSFQNFFSIILHIVKSGTLAMIRKKIIRELRKAWKEVKIPTKHQFKKDSRRVLFQTIADVELSYYKKAVKDSVTEANKDNEYWIKVMEKQPERITKTMRRLKLPAEVITVYQIARDRQARYPQEFFEYVLEMTKMNFFINFLSLSFLFVFIRIFLSDLAALIDGVNGEWSGLKFKKTNDDGITKEYTL
ncbi:MAG: hypothetical protein AAF518_14495 [Spirochaetota bacterium]